MFYYFTDGTKLKNHIVPVNQMRGHRMICEPITSDWGMAGEDAAYTRAQVISEAKRSVCRAGRRNRISRHENGV